MCKRIESIKLIGEAVLALKPHITKEELKKIMREREFVIADSTVGLRTTDIWDSPDMFSYEQVVRIVAEENKLTHLTDPIFEKLAEVKERD